MRDDGSKPIKIAIDASRNRSGGAVAHILGIITDSDPEEFGIVEVHIWAYPALLNLLPEKRWLKKHAPAALEKSLAHQVWWQRFKLPIEFAKADCDIILNTDAGTVSTITPAVTMSRDMLSYEKGITKLFGISKARLRILLLRYVQNRSFRTADGVIFLTRYASKVIQDSCGALKSVALIPHGISSSFRAIRPSSRWPENSDRPIRCLYVSNTDLYKNQWVVVDAIGQLRRKGHNIALTLVGGGEGPAQRKLLAAIDKLGVDKSAVEQMDFLPHAELPSIFNDTDIFVFASRCENMPNTLIEAMAMGIPIACSNCGPMPEVLESGGVLFDPQKAESLSNALEEIIDDSALRHAISREAFAISQKYSWERCGRETWRYLKSTLQGTYE